MGITVSVSSNANEIYLQQSGSNLELHIVQDGNNNKIGQSNIKFVVNGTSNELVVLQTGTNNEVGFISAFGTQGSYGGDINGNSNTFKFEQYNTTGSDTNKIQMHIAGSSNNIHACQGKSFTDASDATCEASSSTEYGGHTAVLDVHGNNNNIKVSQETGTGNADHNIELYVYSGTNDVFIKQKGNGNKNAYLLVYTDGGEQSIVQKDDGAHTATVTLSGAYHTDLNLIQYGSTDQTYTLTQDCQTVGGCALSVTQN